MTLKPRWLREEEYEQETTIISGINIENVNSTTVNFDFKMIPADQMCQELMDSGGCLCRRCKKRCNNRSCIKRLREAENEVKLYNFNVLHLNNFYCETEINITFRHRTIVDSSKNVIETLKGDMENLDLPSNMNKLYNKYSLLIKCKICDGKLQKLFVNWLKMSFDNLHRSMTLMRQKIRDDSLNECHDKCIKQTPLYNLTTVKIKNKQTR